MSQYTQRYCDNAVYASEYFICLCYCVYVYFCVSINKVTVCAYLFYYIKTIAIVHIGGIGLIRAHYKQAASLELGDYKFRNTVVAKNNRSTKRK